MSIQDAKAFFNAIVTDDNFRSQLQDPKTNEERAVAIRAAGYNFTPEESQQLLNQITEAAAIANSLSEAELEAVAGGAAGPGGALLGALGGTTGALIAGKLHGSSSEDILKDQVAWGTAGAIGGAQGPS
ncbi:MAG: Nif11-like leader peptide family natural product precursor [Nostoc sp. DedSLP03]|uniref:Nif11-like leader peptide family natural product precursor n=1 Tax=Nostoc sp. DedSLP03 TaxID=3075400 RepID=UPI002AD2D5F6|nr:Nif11-like leader peptide family natural product precursor [Nostoc sp. DedSLP03]MDZ7966144.1 Nif11-like leader peptide family natural product precursor [Nostoc sp. DedSLP03]